MTEAAAQAPPGATPCPSGLRIQLYQPPPAGRRAAAGDGSGVFAALAALERAAFARRLCWGEAGLAAEAGRRNARLLTATLDGGGGGGGEVVVGYLLLKVAGGAAHISMLAVAPRARRRGVARALVRAALAAERARRRGGGGRVALHVDPGNGAALALYGSLGFRRGGELADYYGPGQPALKLRLELDGV